MGWVFRDRGVGWLSFTCVFRPPSGSLLRACFQENYKKRENPGQDSPEEEESASSDGVVLYRFAFSIS